MTPFYEPLKMWDKNGLKYLLIPDIAKKHRCENLFLTANADNPFFHYNLFVFEILNMLIGKAGRKFNYKKTITQSGGYSNVISD